MHAHLRSYFDFISVFYFFLNFLLKPARPIKPEPTRSMVAGSGTGAIFTPATENSWFSPHILSPGDENQMVSTLLLM